MPIAITAEQRALAETIHDWAKRARPLDSVRRAADAGGCQHERARGLEEIGLFGIGVRAELGGIEASVVDVATGVGEAATVLAGGPVLGSILSGLVLGHAPDCAAAKNLAPTLADGSAHAAVAVTGGSLRANHAAAGGLLVDGDAGLVLDANPAAHLLLWAEVDGEPMWFVLPPFHPGVSLEQPATLDFSRPLARVRLAEVYVPADALVSGPLGAEPRHTALTLACAEAAGIAEWCVETASDYAKTREQFGKPIGSFQAVKALCAQMLCRTQTAVALAWDAARAADDGPQQHAVASTVAAARCLDHAVDNAKDCIQVLGGLGFTWEHDAHFYLRRALALRQLFGGGDHWRVQAAELALGGHRRQLDVDPVSYGAAGQLTEGERGHIRDTVGDIARAAPEYQRVRLAETGYLAPHWPRPYGLEATPAAQLAIDAELDRAGVHRPDLVIGGWAAPTLLEHGSPEQQEKFVGPTLRGEIIWCQLFSEPESGSDLASLTTKASKVDGGWVLSGHKVWTSVAAEAHWAICLARTDPDAAKHKGITYFLVDMTADGIETRPLREITGDALFNEVFLDRVYVPDSQVVGEVNGGWRLARTTLANERVAMSGGSSVGAAVESLLTLVRREALDADALTLSKVGGLVSDGVAGSLLDRRAVIRRLEGHDPGAESSVRKLLGVRHRQEVAEAALELTGPRGALVEDADADIAYEFLRTRCLSIAGGTTQILSNVAAERVLGLPRG